jgi:hypothetical protein
MSPEPDQTGFQVLLDPNIWKIKLKPPAPNCLEIVKTPMGISLFLCELWLM